MPGKKVQKRWVKCEECGYEMESRMARPQCGNKECRSYNIKEIDKPSTIKVEPEKAKTGRPPGRPKGKVLEEGKEKEFEITIGATPVYFNIDELADLQAMVKTGLGKDVSDVIKRCIRNEMRRSLGGESMLEKKDPEDTLKEIKTTQLIDAERKRIEAEADEVRRKGKEMTDTDLDKLESMMTKQMRLRALEANLKRMEKGDSSPLEQMMTMQMYRDMGMGGGSGSANEALIKRLDGIESTFKKMEEDKKFEELRKLVLESISKPRGASEADLLTKMAEIQSKRDTDIEKVRGELAQARVDVMKTELGAKIERLESAMSGGRKLDIKEVKDVVESAKELATVIGPSKERSTTETAMELIGSTIDKIKEPILQPIGEAAAEKIRSGGRERVEYVNLPPGQTEPIHMEPGSSNIQLSNPSNPEEDYSDIVQVSTETTKPKKK